MALRVEIARLIIDNRIGLERDREPDIQGVCHGKVREHLRDIGRTDPGRG